jgi:hypothetical protein
VPSALSFEDRFEIHELLHLYGHLVDSQRWEDLGLVFTPDATYDALDFDLPLTHSVAELAELWAGPQARHPLAHHATNIVVTPDDDGSVRVVSKGIGVGDGGRVGSCLYEDVAVRTDDGWRLSYRKVTLRRR